MNVIVCVDDDYGMLFNHRRQSSDWKLTEKIEELAEGKLWIHPFSEDLFPENVRVDEKMLEHAGDGEFCFVENLDLTPYKEKTEILYLIHWNRKYPSDFKFNKKLLKEFQIKKTEDFIGKAHEKITMEAYRRA